MGVAMGTAADEAALIAAIGTAATAAGWTVVTGIPATTTWFLSRGSSGIHQIVGGLQPAGTRQLIAYAAADLDQDGIVNPSVSGYTNNDEANAINAAAKVNSATVISQWRTRTNLTTITYLIAVTPDAIAVLVEYPASISTTQGIIYLGKTIPVVEPLYAYACATIAAIDASTPATTVVTLDRNINNALKDQATYPSDTDAQMPLFQSVSGPGMVVTDFALVQRIAIISGSLTTSGGNTRFSIDATAGGGTGKLIGITGGTNTRYRDGRGVGDIVRVCAEPNIAVAYSTNSATSGVATNHLSIAAWDASGASRGSVTTNQIDVGLGDRVAIASTAVDPAVERNRFVPYFNYAVVIDAITTTLVPTSDARGRKNVGALHNVIRTSQATAGTCPRLSMVTLNNRSSQRYRTFGVSASGLRNLASLGENAQARGIFVGPGW